MVSVSRFLWHFCWSCWNCSSYLEILRTFFEAYHWFYPVSLQRALRILIWMFCPLTVLGVLTYLHWLIYVWEVVKSWNFCQENHYLQNWFSDGYCTVSIVLCAWEWQLSWDVLVDMGSLFNWVVMLRDMIKGTCTWTCSSVYLKTRHLESGELHYSVNAYCMGHVYGVWVVWDSGYMSHPVHKA
jgi:hypothetical protein